MLNVFLLPLTFNTLLLYYLNYGTITFNCCAKVPLLSVELAKTNVACQPLISVEVTKQNDMGPTNLDDK